MNSECMHIKCKSIVTVMWNILQELNFTSPKTLKIWSSRSLIIVLFKFGGYQGSCKE
jgi:hypothetical protein